MIGLWNLNRLAHALSGLLSTEQLKQALSHYGPVIERQAEDRHIIGVHHAMREADALPLGNQAGGTAIIRGATPSATSR
jgi:uncharacterized protein YdiU (UPF0061 family)